MSLRIAIVGCGKIADGHVEEIKKMPGQAEVVAVCDREMLMAEQMATRYGLPAYYDSFEKMLDEARPDVVHITTPPSSHLALARASVDAGCHVYMEKPLGLNRRRRGSAGRHGAQGGQEDDHRLHLSLRSARARDAQADGEGAMGEIVHLESYYGYSIGGQFGSAILGDAGHWVHDLPGKLFQNNIDHMLNKLTEFMDDDEPASTRPPGAGARPSSATCATRCRTSCACHVRRARVGVQDVQLAGQPGGPLRPRLRQQEHHARRLRQPHRHARAGLEVSSAIGRLLPAFGQAMQFAREGARNSRRLRARRLPVLLRPAAPLSNTMS